MHARVQVSAAAVDGFSAGQAATVSVAGRQFDGRLDYLAAEADGSGQYLLTFSFDPGEAALRAGLPAKVETQGPAAASR